MVLLIFSCAIFVQLEISGQQFKETEWGKGVLFESNVIGQK